MKVTQQLHDLGQSLWQGPLAGADRSPGTGHSACLRHQALAIPHGCQHEAARLCPRALVANWPCPALDYTARFISHRDGLALPPEDAHVLWQR